MMIKVYWVNWRYNAMHVCSTTVTFNRFTYWLKI